MSKVTLSETWWVDRGNVQVSRYPVLPVSYLLRTITGVLLTGQTKFIILLQRFFMCNVYICEVKIDILQHFNRDKYWAILGWQCGCRTEMLKVIKFKKFVFSVLFELEWVKLCIVYMYLRNESYILLHPLYNEEIRCRIKKKNYNIICTNFKIRI